MTNWNDRRSALIAKELDGTITSAEAVELQGLQEHADKIVDETLAPQIEALERIREGQMSKPDAGLKRFQAANKSPEDRTPEEQALLDSEDLAQPDVQAKEEEAIIASHAKLESLPNGHYQCHRCRRYFISKDNIGEQSVCYDGSLPQVTWQAKTGDTSPDVQAVERVRFTYRNGGATGLTSGYGCNLAGDQDGEYVRVSDYEALLARTETLETVVVNAKLDAENPSHAAVRHYMEYGAALLRGDEAIAEVEKLHQEVEQLTQRAEAAEKKLEIIHNCTAKTIASTPMLPCRVDEMTEREHQIFAVGANFSGAINFINELEKQS